MRERGHVWYERYVTIIVATLERHFMPGSWRVFDATWVDNWTFIGTVRLLHDELSCSFLRFLPVIAVAEVAMAVLPEANPHHDDHHEKGVHELEIEYGKVKISLTPRWRNFQHGTGNHSRKQSPRLPG